MNNQRNSFCNVLNLSICLILVIAFYLDLLEQEVSLQDEYSLTEIRDDYMRIIVERGSERTKNSMEALQMAIFTYLMAQRKLSDVRVSGLDPDSSEYKDAEEEFKYALDCLRMARVNWESRINTIPIFSSKKEHITKHGARRSFHDFDFNSIFSGTGKGYTGDKGVDFQMDIYEDTEPIYNPPQNRKKLDKTTINKMNLGFQFNDLPAKLVKSINDRNEKKQAKIGSKGRQIRGDSKDIFRHGNSNINARQNKDLLSIEKLLNSKRPTDHTNIIDNLLEGIAPKGVKLGGPGYQKQKDTLDLKIKNNLDMFKKHAQTGTVRFKKPEQDERHKPERSRGVLSIEPEIPSDVANQIEKKLGGPMNYIDVSTSDLSKDNQLNRLYTDYIQATLRCIQLYESNSVFEEIFPCTRKQVDLSFNLLQKLRCNKTSFTFKKYDVLEIMSKFNIKSIKQPKHVEKNKEIEEFLELLINNKIFSPNPLAGNTTKPDNSSLSISNAFPHNERTYRYIPSYLYIYMDKYRFTSEEYYSNPKLIMMIEYLASLEAEFAASGNWRQKGEYNKFYIHKMLSDMVMAELINIRTKSSMFNETKASTN